MRLGAALLAGALLLAGSAPAVAQKIPERLPPDLETLRGAAEAASPVTTTPAAGATALEGAIDPTEYVLGPGDLLEVVYTGSSQPSERVRVTPSGRIHLAPTGPVEVAGLTLEEAGARIREALARFYADTRISVDLLEVRKFRVHLSGHVEEPGSFTVSASDRASDLLDAEAKLLPRASLRNLVLRRGDREILVDLVRYRLLGDLSANPYLEDGDVLLVPAQRDSVSVFGRVARQGFLEFRRGDTVSDLIDLAGGFDFGADTEAVELRRFDPEDPRAARRHTLDFTRGAGSLPAEPGDGVYVRSRPAWRRERLVELRGEVRYPGVYAIEEAKETLRSLIDRAGGFTEEADPSATEVYRPNVFDRPEEDPEFQRLQAIPIQEMSNDEFEYLKLRSRQREGLASSVLSLSLVDRERGEDLILRAGDRVTVPRKNLAVDVEGAVKNPGFVPWHPDRTADDYIRLAGGKTDRARTGKTRVIRARTGERVKAGRDTAVDPGDLVWVPEKQDRNWWRIARETAVFLAQIGTLVVIVDSIRN